jgi:predicted DNA-binding protein with PD1-like motif
MRPTILGGPPEVAGYCARLPFTLLLESGPNILTALVDVIQSNEVYADWLTINTRLQDKSLAWFSEVRQYSRWVHSVHLR